MEKTVDKYQLLEFEFSSNLVRFLKLFNLLERNVGLCISWLVNHSDPRVAYPFLDKLTTQGKMDILKELIFYKYSETNQEMIRDFNEWFKLASEARAVRNRYIHGYWDALFSRGENPIIFQPTVWTSGVGKRKAERDSSQKMSLNEFKVIVQEMESVFEKFMELREKYDV